MHIRGLIPRYSMELAEAVPIEGSCELQTKAARDQEHIFHFIKYTDYFIRCENVFKIISNK